MYIGTKKGRRSGIKLLEVKNITKLYNKLEGIQDISLKLEHRQIYALIGPNGAGKTTFVRILAGLLNPSEGEVLLNGEPTIWKECKKNIGFALELEEGYPKKTILEMFDFICEIKYCGKYGDDIKKILCDFELWESRSKLIQDCSFGMKKKVQIGISFLGSPELILLDEPTNGVDTNGILMLKQYIMKEKNAGKIIVITSHVLDFVESLADNIIFLNGGKVVKVMKNSGNLEGEYRDIFLKS